MSDFDARFESIERRLTEVESHLPRIGESEGHIVALAGKMAALVYEVGELRNVTFNAISTARHNHEEVVLKLDILVEMGRLER